MEEDNAAEGAAEAEEAMEEEGRDGDGGTSEEESEAPFCTYSGPALVPVSVFPRAKGLGP